MMGEGHSGLPSSSTQGPDAWTLDALAHAAWQLEPPPPHEEKSVLRPEAAHLVDSLLARVARGRGALDVAIGGALARLSEGDRVLQLAYSGIGDYARERLGMASRTAQAMARLAVELRARPLLAEAVRRGEVSARKAQAVLPLARGQDEEQWVARAQTETVRALEAAVRAAGPAEAPLSPEGRATLDQALELAGKHLGPGAPQWQRLEAICQEYLAAHPVDTSDGASFAHYCAERLGMAARTVEQRVWLERRLYALPPLRRALREGRGERPGVSAIALAWCRARESRMAVSAA
jgi:hypothetical protein